MNKPQITTTAAILFAVATIGIGIANAQGNTSSQGGNAQQNRSFVQEHNNAMAHALEAKDYVSFVDAVGTDAKILDVITAENFDQFFKMHELMQSDDIEGAKAIANELGIPAMGNIHRGGGNERMKPRGDRGGLQLTKEQRTAVNAALETGDYSAFVKAHGDNATRITETQFNRMSLQHQEKETNRAAVDAAIDARDYSAFVKAAGTRTPFLDHINETNFAQFAEMHDLMQAGDWEGAKTIADELGIPADQQHGESGGMGMMKGRRGIHGVFTNQQNS
ncbi:MAG: hypothetical protein CO029_03535 [Candidatus Magasanikbacteria bacterium CG_4_9_14_0_2_um_filter_41_10]|uniref:Uncharacterized protein n=1 Tax=Candidatus Magasanikbacteria bacterium CG_4_10_14_0_2_um_filter_41_31 TaxID=1974639 RepID=A0A2M7V5I4_9BACT|nr:MAG: hypothetical protein AUJ37_02125 [Candidatus Magasanikbacteria bacterium CG1_02_41_34]PIZ93876.1 MAG: hypothetical protein COX83_00705 [Candidatus Magasanikbacteria bacterium CG_4_10_14_0_2_um_filter_41_31]PJC53286.1 MAG: hypothetical protein CO029_03535 [Candidatus Magasanikbacteria bacterium CG_4_9_14_0_2_um_filter_41_10]